MKELAIGTTIRDTYTVVRFLGQGAFGNVYLTRHRYMGLQAMKLFPVRGIEDALEEAFVLSRLGDPHIVRVFEANTFHLKGEEVGYFSMEYAEDGTLADWLSSTPSMNDRLAVLPQLASGLACAHSQSPPIVHRDIKPSNVLIKKSSTGSIEVKLSDFGLAKALDIETKLASAAGTYFYMAPEVFDGKESSASDIYSLGLTFYEVLTGRHPFQIKVPAEPSARTVAALVRATRTHQVEPPSAIDDEIPSDMNGVVVDILQFETAKRIQNAVDLRNRLSSFENRAPTSRSTDQLLADAFEKSRQQSTLDEAVQLLQSAMNSEMSVSREYGPLLDLLKRGIIQ